MADTYSDAIEKLKADHDRVEALFDKAGKASPEETRKIGVQVCNLVKIHMTLEEEFLYPALRGKSDDDDKLTEGLVEHDAGKVLINDLLSGDNDDDTFGPKLQVLGEQMKHHHKEEEENGKGVFDQARKAKLDLKAMLKDMEEREAELKAELKDGDLPAAETIYVDAGKTT